MGANCVQLENKIYQDGLVASVEKVRHVLIASDKRLWDVWIASNVKWRDGLIASWN